MPFRLADVRNQVMLLFVKSHVGSISSSCFSQEAEIAVIPPISGVALLSTWVCGSFFLTSVVAQDHTDVTRLYCLLYTLCKTACTSSLLVQVDLQMPVSSLNVILICSLCWFNMVQLSFYLCWTQVPDMIFNVLFCRRENRNSKKIKNIMIT